MYSGAGFANTRFYDAYSRGYLGNFKPEHSFTPYDPYEIANESNARARAFLADFGPDAPFHDNEVQPVSNSVRQGIMHARYFGAKSGETSRIRHPEMSIGEYYVTQGETPDGVMQETRKMDFLRAREKKMRPDPQLHTFGDGPVYPGFVNMNPTLLEAMKARSIYRSELYPFIANQGRPLNTRDPRKEYSISTKPFPDPVVVDRTYGGVANARPQGSALAHTDRTMYDRTFEVQPQSGGVVERVINGFRHLLGVAPVEKKDNFVLQQMNKPNAATPALERDQFRAFQDRSELNMRAPAERPPMFGRTPGIIDRAFRDNETATPMAANRPAQDNNRLLKTMIDLPAEDHISYMPPVSRPPQQSNRLLAQMVDDGAMKQSELNTPTSATRPSRMRAMEQVEMGPERSMTIQHGSHSYNPAGPSQIEGTYGTDGVLADHIGATRPSRMHDMSRAGEISFAPDQTIDSIHSSANIPHPISHLSRGIGEFSEENIL